MSQIEARPDAERVVTGVHRVTKQPATKAEIREALARILRVSRTCWDGEAIADLLMRAGFELDDPHGQLLFLDELTELCQRFSLKIALTTSYEVRRWIIQLVAVP